MASEFISTSLLQDKSGRKICMEVYPTFKDYGITDIIHTRTSLQGYEQHTTSPDPTSIVL